MEPEAWFFHNGEYYEFVVELEGDQFTIKDVCDRYIPFAHTSLVDLFNAILVTEHYVHPIIKGQKAIEKVLSNEVRTV